MRGKNRLLIVILILLNFLLLANKKLLINSEKLKNYLDNSPKLKDKRDLFSKSTLFKRANNKREYKRTPIYSRDQEKEIKLKEEKESSDAFLIKSRVNYEGYVLKKKKLMALLTLDGEFNYAFKGDEITKGLFVLAITTNKIVFKYKKIKVDIPLKGDDNENK